MLGIVLIIVFVAVMLVHLLSRPNVKYIPMHLTVGNYTGFNVDTSALFFGTVTKSGRSTRYVVVTNELEEPVMVLVEAAGELADWTTVSEKNFSLDRYGSKTISVSVNAPAQAQYGIYSGLLKFTFIK